jgi:IS30 family transposase
MRHNHLTKGERRQINGILKERFSQRVIANEPKKPSRLRLVGKKGKLTRMKAYKLIRQYFPKKTRLQTSQWNRLKW